MKRLSLLVPNRLTLHEETFWKASWLSSKELRTSWEGWCEHPGAAARVGAGPQQGYVYPSLLGNVWEQDEADSQVEQTAFSGVGGKVGRFFPLP